MKQWKCTVCGYIHTGDEPPSKCPVCGADKSKFQLVPVDDSKEQLREDTAVQREDTTPGPADENLPIQLWKCSVCGYIHKGTAPPSKCPVCGADKSKFQLVQEKPLAEDDIGPSPGTTDPSASVSAPATDAGTGFKSSFGDIASRVNILTRLHGHPIAVHIPNGVLPLAFIFTLFAVLFKSEALATAAKYNMIFISLAMPAVLFTGAVDWFNRFNGAMTNVFMIKIICAGVVTLLSFIIAIWWIVDGEIYLGGTGRLAPFLFLCLTDLAAAVVAGFYGGKLVFNN